MKNKIKAAAHLPGMLQSKSRDMYVSVTVSGVCHLLFLTVLIFVPGLKIPSRPSYSVINVNMVTLPAKGTSVRANTRAAVNRPTAKTNKTSDGVSFKAVSIAPKKKVVTKKAVTPSETVKNAIDRVKNEAETSRPGQVNSAIERIKDRVKETDANRRAVEDTNTELAGVESGVSGGSGLGSGSPLDILTLYKYEIRDLVQQNWAYSEQLADAKSDLQASLVFEVMPDGHIRDIWFTEKSGNRYLDESAHKAVMKSNPFPPFPGQLSRPMVEVALRFTPKGLLE